MSRVAKAFERAKTEHRAALVAYLCAGDPSLERTRELVPLLFEAGADLVELGLPFSDPIADGPVIQAASFRALQAGTTTAGVLETVAAIRASGCDGPIAIMSYLNPILSMGLESFAKRAAAAGVDALVLPDVPLEQAEQLEPVFARHGIELALLAAPTTPADRLARIGARAKGFLYFVSVAGVTGARRELPPELIGQLRAAKAASKAPVVVGFGIGRPEQVKELAPHADGVVVGSALVRLLNDGGGPAELKAFVSSLAQATFRSS